MGACPKRSWSGISSLACRSERALVVLCPSGNNPHHWLPFTLNSTITSNTPVPASVWNATECSPSDPTNTSHGTHPTLDGKEPANPSSIASLCLVHSRRA